MTRSLKAVALVAALLALGSAAAITHTASANGFYAVARAQTGGEIIDGDRSTGPVSGVYH
jgi:hypothetical protein